MFARYINVNGKLMDLSVPRVMGILNVTPDSFYAESRKQGADDVKKRVMQMLDEGADIIDIGGYSSRPGAADVSVEEEMKRLRNGLEALRSVAPDAVVSVDTFRADAAKMCVEEYGAAIINDISAGELDDRMLPTAARLGVPYCLMHMKGTPHDMQDAPAYKDDILKEVLLFMARKIATLRDLGAKDIILDPGFGFGKTLEHNYELMAHLNEFSIFEMPLLVGISRKSMIYRLLDTDAEGSLNGTAVLNTIALLKGANILRVHDVRQAVEAIKIVGQTRKFEFTTDN